MNFNGPTQRKQSLEDRQDEKSRLLVKFRRQRREEWAALIKEEPRLEAFGNALKGAAPSDVLKRLFVSPLRTAEPRIRYAALRLIDREANRITRLKGGQVLDDPLPPHRNLYIAAREILGVR